MPDKIDRHKQLLDNLVRLVRLDAVGPSLQPNLISDSLRTTLADGSPIPAGTSARYPGSTLTLSPPKLRDVEQTGNLTWQSTALVAYAFPNFVYSQLPVGQLANLTSRLVARLPKPYRVTAADCGAEQLDGSDVWLALLKLIIEWTQPVDKLADVSELQPGDFGDLPDLNITQVNINLWRSPIPLSIPDSVLDAEL